jgi:hypothetical protein
MVVLSGEIDGDAPMAETLPVDRAHVIEEGGLVPVPFSSLASLASLAT